MKNKVSDQVKPQELIRLFESAGSFGQCVIDYWENHEPDQELLQLLTGKFVEDATENLNKDRLVTIISALQKNHKYYVHHSLPELGQAFSGLLKTGQPDFRLALAQTMFNLFATALIQHIDEEERAFAQLTGEKRNYSAANQLFHAHADETQALDQIIDMLMECTNPSAFDPCHLLVLRLKNLSNDLKIHTFVEENLLLPALQKMIQKETL